MHTASALTHADEASEAGTEFIGGLNVLRLSGRAPTSIDSPSQAVFAAQACSTPGARAN